MRNKIKYSLYCCNIILMGLIVLNIFTYNLDEETTSTTTLSFDDRRFISYLLIESPLNDENILPVSIEEKEEISTSINQTEKNDSNKKDDNKNDKQVVTSKEDIEKSDSYKPKEENTKKEDNQKVIETLVGSLAGYGPDCYGCTSNKTASGRYIGNGNIYYDDTTYGKVRIVAGDYSYPFGTIVRISNVDFYNDEPFYAIVLDRGGDIGKNKKFLFDLLFASERDALGREVNIKFEIMRLGY